MRIYIGTDHRGFELKEQIKEWLESEEHEVVDVGNYQFDPEDDYTEYGIKVAEMVEGASEPAYADDGELGILLCGSGHGMEIVANRFPHVRAVLGFNAEVTAQGREHEDANLLVLATDWVNAEEAIERVKIFLGTEMIENEKYARRRAMLSRIGLR